MQKLRVGEVELIALSDGSVALSPAALFPAVTAEAWEPFRSEYLDTEGRLRLNVGAFLLRSEGEHVLIDTGVGTTGTLGLRTARLPDELRAAGVRPDEISVVVMTHMHPDHVGGCTERHGDDVVPAFPNARYMIDRREWEYWVGNEPAKSTMDTCALPLERSGRLVLTEPEHRPTRHITMLPTPGHTPGHISVLITSDGERAVVLGDVSHSPVQVSHPDWSTVGDIDKDLGRASRVALFDRIEREEMRVAAGHYGAENFGHFARIGGERRWEAQAAIAPHRATLARSHEAREHKPPTAHTG